MRDHGVAPAVTGAVPRRPDGPVAVGLLVAGAVSAVAAAVAGGPQTRFAVGGVVAIGAGAAVLAARRPRPGGDPGGVLHPLVVGGLMLVSGAAWLLHAVAAAAGSTAAARAVDVVAPTVGGVAVAALLRAAPVTGRGRRTVLLLDGAVVVATVLLAAWVVAVGPRTGLRVDRPGEAWVAVLVAVLLCQAVVAALVVAAGSPSRSAPTLVAIGLVALAGVGVVLGGLGPARTVPVAALLAWCAGWMLLAHRAVRGPAPDPRSLTPRDLARHDIVSTEVFTVVAGGALLLALAGYVGRGGTPGLPPVGILLILLTVLAVAAREVVLGRDRVALLDDLSEQADLDPLTGLANRRALSDRVARLATGEWVILALDLDGFKAVNDVHGHATGDAVLAGVADVLRAHCPPGGLAARTGGDEFAMLVPGDVERGRMHAQEIVRAVPPALEPLHLGPTVTASVGVGRLVPGAAGPADDPLGALIEASAALHAAKAAGRNRVQVYPGFVARGRERRLDVETALRRAVGAGTVRSVGQPLVDLVTGRVVAVEALARLHDPALGDVPPAEFIAVAEECGLVADVGRAVLRSALVGFADNTLVGSGLRLSVNVSPVELRTPRFVEHVARTLAEFDFPARHLTVEVTEAVLVEEDDPAVRVLAALGDLGAHVAIDDFGTGYSALGYLRRLPVQSLKIDRSLVVDARTSVRTRHIVAGVVDLASRLGLIVTIEGIEDEAAVRLGREVGAHLGQGYLSGRPMPWADVAAAWQAGPRTGRS